MFLVASSANEGPDNNSELDTSTRNRNINPEKIRGEIIQHLLQRPVIIPKVAMDELNSTKTTRKLGPQNIQNRSMIQDAIRGVERAHIPTCLDIQQQTVVTTAVRFRAEKLAEKIKAIGGLVPDHWDKKKDDLDENEKSQAIDPELDKDPFCQLHRKFKPEQPKIEAALCQIIGAKETPQRELLQQAKQIRKLVFEPGLNRNEIERLSQEIARLEMDAQELQPYLMPDLEIRSITENAKAALLSYDNDFHTLNQVCKNPVELVPRRQGVPSTVKELLAAVRQNRKEFPQPEI